MYLDLIAAIGLACTALAAGWLNSVDAVPNKASYLYRLPLIGSSLSRLNTSGWLIIITTLFLLGLSAWSKEKAEKQEEKKIAALSNCITVQASLLSDNKKHREYIATITKYKSELLLQYELFLRAVKEIEAGNIHAIAYAAEAIENISSTIDLVPIIVQERTIRTGDINKLKIFTEMLIKEGNYALAPEIYQLADRQKLAIQARFDQLPEVLIDEKEKNLSEKCEGISS